MKKENHKPFVDLCSARKYYGPHATGSVVLVSGRPVFHGSTKEAKEMIKSYRSNNRYSVYPQK